VKAARPGLLGLPLGEAPTHVTDRDLERMREAGRRLAQHRPPPTVRRMPSGLIVVRGGTPDDWKRLGL
jgi:hypothetical protein